MGLCELHAHNTIILWIIHYRRTKATVIMIFEWSKSLKSEKALGACVKANSQSRHNYICISLL